MRRLDLTILVLVFALAKLNQVVAECPIGESTYARWSDPATWDDQFQNGEIPDVANITITKPILLDVENPKEVFSITIGEPNGILLFSDNIDIAMRTHNILIKDKGSLIIGTEECKHQANVQITLIGNEGDYNIEGFDEKFIGCDKGGTIELHGKRKHPWTKLAKTVPKIDEDHGLIFRHTDDPNRLLNPGLVVHVFNTLPGIPEKSITKKLNKKQNKFDAVVAKIEEFLNDVEDGKVIAVAVQYDFYRQDTDISTLTALISSLTGSTLFSQMDRKAYAAVTIKGDPSSTVEKLAPATAEISVSFDDIQVFVKSVVSEKDLVEFLVMDTVKAQQILHLNNDVTSWEVGDKILLTSTDYEWDHSEECQIMQCDSCASHQIKVLCDYGPKYTHFADVCGNIDRLDMRGEVGLLTRNIKIMGETDGVFGGHIKMLKGFKNAHFEGLELTKMGQNTALGRYPIHFHMCEDVGPETYEKPSYIRANSIHHTFARATTIHGTHNCTVHYNFVYDTLGHAIFLEDGGEKDNVIEWNLVGGQRPTGLIIADRKPTSYWITNPKTYVRNNIAFGSDDAGFWFVYPKLPIGPSREKDFMQYNEAKHTAIYEFVGNVAHSCKKVCLFIDNILFDDTSVSGYNTYDPRQNLLDKKSEPKDVYLTNFTAFKCKERDVWGRGSSLTLQYCSLADGSTGTRLQKDGKFSRTIEKCIMIGDSCNVEEGTTLGGKFGVDFDKGPLRVRDTFFDNFTSNSIHNGSAIRQVTRDGSSSVLNSVAGILFGFDDIEGAQSRLYSSPTTRSQVHPIGSFRDKDGSVTGIAKSQVVPLEDYLLTPDCKIRDHWLMAACPNYYAKIAVTGGGGNATHMARDEYPFPMDKVFRAKVKQFMEFEVIVGGIYSYTMEYQYTLPSELKIQGLGITRSEWVRVGLCVPRINATFQLKERYFPTTTTFADFSEVNSMEEVESDNTGTSYMYDRDVGVLIMKMISKYERKNSVHDSGECLQHQCPEITITFLTGDLTDCNCHSRLHEKYNKTIEVEPATPYPDVLPATASIPPGDWGAEVFPPVPDYP